MGFFKNLFSSPSKQATNVPDDVQASASNMGERLGVLISTLFSEADRPQVLAALEAMTPEQLVEFYQDLEKRFQEAAIIHDQSLDQAYAQEVDSIKAEHLKQEAAIKNQTISELDDLEKELSK
jgi:hypothetical protein